MKRTNIIIYAVFLFTLAWGLPMNTVHAQVDARCFQEKQCQNARNGQKGGFYQSNETAKVCGDKTIEIDNKKVPVGFCTPVGQATAKVSIGGQQNFANIGDYIQTIYNYGVGVVSIFAVIMIVIAGLQWASSGGNTSIIQSAKKRIGGAIIGLLLAVFSYTILTTINPYLVNLRLPQVWMINGQSIAPNLCVETPDKKLSTSSQGPFNISVKTKEEACGQQFFIEGGGSLTCMGTWCKPRQLCLPDGDEHKCVDNSILGGKITATAAPFSNEFYQDRIIDNNIQLIGVCNDGTLDLIRDKDIDTVQDEKDQGKRFRFKYNENINDINTSCDSNGGVAGFYIGAEINDESGIGSAVGLPAGSTLSGGNDDWHAIGKANKNSYSCNRNLALLAQSIQGKGSPSCDDDEAYFQCSCAAISDEDILRELVTKEAFTDHLITKEELINGGFICDIHIDRGEFPAIDNFGAANFISGAGTPFASIIAGPLGVAITAGTAFDDDTDCFEMQNTTFDGIFGKYNPFN